VARPSAHFHFADGRRVFTHDQDAPRIAVIDTATNKITTDCIAGRAYASEPTPRWTMVAGGQHGKAIACMSLICNTEGSFVRWKFQRDRRKSYSPGGDIAYVSGTGRARSRVLDLRSRKNAAAY